MPVGSEDFVTPCVGVWIETEKDKFIELTDGVTPCVGVWIETPSLIQPFPSLTRSHPAWVCGLKPARLIILGSLRRVTPCVGVWIETFVAIFMPWVVRSHPAWVCGLKQSINYIASAIKESHPAWVCGLKHLIHGIDDGTGCHTLRGCVD